jgi:hypothetical protein
LTFISWIFDESDLPDPERLGERGPKFQYLEWLIMFIEILSAKLKVKTYVAIYWIVIEQSDQIAASLDLKPISERQLRDRKKNSPLPWKSRCFHLSTVFWTQTLIGWAVPIKWGTAPRARNGIKKDKGIIPKNLRRIDKQAEWCKFNADGWIHGPDRFCLTAHMVAFIGCFVWMKSSTNEAKRLWLETARYKGMIDYVATAPKADEYDLFREFSRQHKITLDAYCREHR